MKYLYLIRHCETKEIAGEQPAHAWNDSALSENGLRQVEKLADRLIQEPVDLFLTSLLQRSQQTAAILNRERGAPLFSSMALNEYLLRDDHRGVETVDQGLVRSLGFLNEFRPYFDCIAVVGHNSILSTIRASLLNAPFDSGGQAFSLPGTCRALRYDWGKGDENWTEVSSFAP